MDFTFDFTPAVQRMPKKTPLETHKIIECTVTFQDGTTLTLPSNGDDGFYRVSEYISKGKGFVNHEVFVAYAINGE